MSVSLAFAVQRKTLPTGISMPWLTSGHSSEAALTGPVMHFAADRRIYAEGDEARSYYKVVSGVVRTCRFLSDGRRQIDAFHMPGDVFGIEAGVDHRLSAEAVTECTIIAYRQRGMEAAITSDDRIARLFFTYAMSCLEQTREHGLLLGRGSAAQKLAAFLMEMAERTDSEKAVELATDYLGLTIETVSRTLSQMERDGLIALQTTRKVLLKNHRALEDLNT